MKKVLVTGATGFIGSEIVAVLLSEGFEVSGMSRRFEKHPGGIEMFRADISDAEEMRRTAVGRRFDVVIHCAGLAHQFGRIEEGLFTRVNVKGTENAAGLAARVGAGRFILLSSTAVYGLQDVEMDEEAECRPETPYAESKLKAEEVCRKVCEREAVPLTIFRPAPVLGEKGVGNVPRLIEAIYKGRFLWVGDGSNEKSLIAASDVAGACLAAVRSESGAGGIFNLASEPVTMRELVEVISRKLDRKIPGLRIPVGPVKLIFRLNSGIFKSKVLNRFSQTFEKWISRDVYKADKIKRELGFEPATPVLEAVERQCDWFLKNRAG
jgi:nucleoside-diphosphate-sugar epimerase